jgi:elongation factor Ts
MKIDLKKVKHLRDKTSAPLMLIKEALVASEDNVDKAEKYITENWKLGSGNSKFGLIHSYVHNQKIGVMFELRCGTDFVARTEEVKKLCLELALQLVAGLPEPLESQEWIRDSSQTVAQLIDEVSKKTGESVSISRHIRWEI